MNIVISALTKSVYKDGNSLLNLDIAIPEGVNALYWQGESGWIDNVDSSRNPIGELPDWAQAALETYEVKINPPKESLTPDQIKAAAILNYKSTAQGRLDSLAQSWGYDSILSAASYANSTNEQFKAEALTLIAWRDATWALAYVLLANVQSGKKSAPKNVDEFLAGLPQEPDRPSA